MSTSTPGPGKMAEDPFTPRLKHMPAGYTGTHFSLWLRGIDTMERNARIAWFVKYASEACAAREARQKARKGDILAKCAERDALRRFLVQSQARSRRPQLGKVVPPPPGPSPPQPPCTLASGMKPPALEDHNWLLFGLSWDGEGRAKYLKRRYEDLPWMRWRYPPTVNSEYLWEPHCGASEQCPDFATTGGLWRSSPPHHLIAAPPYPPDSWCRPPPPRPPML